MQFVPDGGTVSPRFGDAIGNTPGVYRGKTVEECLVGMYGAYHGNYVVRIGFSFHQISYSRAVEVSDLGMDQVSVEGEPINGG
jgi:hypothetical protein